MSATTGMVEADFPESVDISEKHKQRTLVGGGIMTKERIEKAIEEATEFIERASKSRVEYMWWPPKTEGGALRRQSMELTRALVEMRKPD